MFAKVLFCLVSACCISSSCTREAPPHRADAALVCYQAQVQPLLITYCTGTNGGCHGADDARVSLTEYPSVMKGIQPGNADGSPYFSVIGSSMPPLSSPQLNAAQQDTIRRWINQGAENTNCGLEFPF
jgi:hypothetical protein